MLRQLRFDLYKLLKSRTMWGIYIASFLLCLVNPAITAIAGQADTFYNTLVIKSPSFFLRVSVILFVVFYVGMDHASGYIKNIYSSLGKAAYLSVKAIYLFIFIVLWYLFYMLLTCIFCAAAGMPVKYQSYDPAVGLVAFKIFAECFSVFGYGMIVALLVLSTKNRLVALVIALVYYFVSPHLFALIDEAIQQLPGWSDFLIERYLFLSEMYIDNYVTTWPLTSAAGWFCGNVAFYIAVSAGLTSLIFIRRKAKD